MGLEYVRPTKVWAYFKEKGIRISADAKTKLLEILNTQITAELDKVIDKLPKYTKGQNKGELKRKTIKLDDLK
ncbi:MAG: hypothetical protein ACTSYB_04025 [Candidatus Helarchaeota archaeon]